MSEETSPSLSDSSNQPLISCSWLLLFCFPFGERRRRQKKQLPNCFRCQREKGVRASIVYGSMRERGREREWQGTRRWEIFRYFLGTSLINAAALTRNRARSCGINLSHSVLQKWWNWILRRQWSRIIRSGTMSLRLWDVWSWWIKFFPSYKNKIGYCLSFMMVPVFERTGLIVSLNLFSILVWDPKMLIKGHSEKLSILWYTETCQCDY